MSDTGDSPDPEASDDVPVESAAGEFTVDDLIEEFEAQFDGESGELNVPGSPDLAGFDSPEQALEVAIESLERASRERDEYLDTARRVQAEFENYRRRFAGERLELSQRAAGDLVTELLPIVDATNAAVAHGSEEVLPIHTMLLATLGKLGLSEIDESGVTFDPNMHDAVMTEACEETPDPPVVLEVLRSGFAWNGRVLRPAMVKVSS